MKHIPGGSPQKKNEIRNAAIEGKPLLICLDNMILSLKKKKSN